jgi:serine/threonine-protein kinase
MMTGQPPTLSKYRLLARLGSGGMAEVYLVLTEGPGGFNKLQVLKLMRSDLTEQERPEFLQMFRDEARLAARLNHPNIVQSFEVGAEDGQPYIVMEFLEGQSLHRIQQRARHLGKGFPLEMELFVLCQVLEGLEYAHNLTDYTGETLHIVHRDVSPQNVFVTYTGQTKLVDFGVAKTLESSKTRAGVVKGKVAYMPPEQITSGPIDHRADLFSVGVLLWEAIAGQPMHAELSVFESLNKLVKGELPRIRDVVPTVSPMLERILQRALAHAPNDRYPDAETFRQDLFNYLESVSKVRSREVGQAVAELFSRERAEMSQIIRKAMTSQPPEPEEPPSIQHITRRVPAVGALQPGTPNGARHDTLAESPTKLDSAASEARTGSPERQQARLRTWRLALLGVASGLALVAFFLLRSEPPQPPNVAPPAVSVPTEVTLPVSPQPSTDVQLSIKVEPKQAAIRLDGRVLGQGSYVARERRDEREHQVVISAPGYATQERKLRLDRDVTLELVLAADAPTPERHHRASRREEPMPPSKEAADYMIDLPAPRRDKRSAPDLDKSNPWEK